MSGSVAIKKGVAATVTISFYFSSFGKERHLFLALNGILTNFLLQMKNVQNSMEYQAKTQLLISLFCIIHNGRGSCGTFLVH